MKKILVLTIAILAMIAMTSCVNADSDDSNATTATIVPTETVVVTNPVELAEPTEIIVETTPTIPETEPIVIDEDITFSYKYVSEEGIMPYGLFTPSTADNNKETPLIVWLHGSGEKDVDESTFSNRGLPYVLNTWTLEGFDAYVLCPHLKWEWNYGAWCLPESKEYLQDLIDKFISEHNVDTEKIIITGHSLGGQGALYMAHELPEYFSKLAVFSGYWTDVDITEIDIPTIGYVGMVYYGEDEYSSMYMAGHFEPAFGEENTFWVPTGHGNLPYVVFNEDKDEDGHSDVIEWMLND